MSKKKFKTRPNFGKIGGLVFTCFLLIAPSLAAEEADEFIVGSIGDSITTAFNASLPLNNKFLSWSTGTHKDKSNSHYHRIKDIFPDKHVRSYNYAVPGAVTDDLLKQVQKLARRSPDYVAFTIGANDVCRTPIEEDFNTTHFEANLSKTIDVLVRKNPEVKILMGLIPDVLNLRYKAIDKAYCSAVWKNLKPCASALHPDRTEAELKRFRDKWEVANQSLVAMASKYPNHVKVPKIEKAYTQFEFDHVSPIDCFHPNAEGQNLLSDLSWEDGWF